MSLRVFRLGVAATALSLGAAWVAGVSARDRQDVRERHIAAAVAAAGGLDVPGYRIERTMPTDRPSARPSVRPFARPPDRLLLDSLRRDEAPRATESGAVAPIKDADGWDVIGMVRVTPEPGIAGRATPWRSRALAPLAVIAAPALWLAWWGGRAGERRRHGTLVAWSFLGIPLLHLAVFSLLPVAFTFYLSVHQWDLVSTARPFVGLANYRELARDSQFWRTLLNTALYVLYVPITMAAALALAVLLNRRRPGERLLRAVVFLPFVTSTVAVALVWQWLFNPDVGLVNYGLSLLHAPGPDWLGNPRTALLAIIAVTVWTQVGYQMIVFLAGLQGVPQTYLDAALVDGATPWQRFRHVTLPLLRPVLLFVLVTGIIAGFQVFTLVYMMTEGGPLHATDVLVYRIYQTAWEFLRFGEASAMAVVLFAILLAVTVIQFRLLGRRIEHV